MYAQCEKSGESSKVVSRRPDALKAFSGVDDRRSLPGARAGVFQAIRAKASSSPGVVQAMQQGDADGARARRQELMQVSPPELITEPQAADVQNARDSLEALRTQIEERVNQNVLVYQPHDGTMAELRARFHNDHVHRTYRGGVEEGHATRTAELLEARIQARALEYARDQARRRRNEISLQITQLMGV